MSLVNLPLYGKDASKNTNSKIFVKILLQMIKNNKVLLTIRALKFWCRQDLQTGLFWSFLTGGYDNETWRILIVRDNDIM